MAPSSTPSSGQQPDALASLEAAAEAGSRKPDGQGLTATPKTRPQPSSEEAEQRRAAEILKDAAQADTGKPADGA